MEMKKIIDTPTVQYTTYEKGCPYDTAISIFDWFDGVWKSDIIDIVRQIWSDKGLNETGRAILEAMKAIDDNSVSKFAKSKEQYKKECKAFKEWKAKNNAVTINGIIREGQKKIEKEKEYDPRKTLGLKPGI